MMLYKCKEKKEKYTLYAFFLIFYISRWVVRKITWFIHYLVIVKLIIILA